MRTAPPRPDVVVGTLLAAVAVVEGAATDEHGAAVAVAGVVGAAALTWRRATPAPAAIAAALPLPVGAALGLPVDDSLVVVACLLGAVFSLALYEDRSRFRVAVGVSATLVAASVPLGGNPTADILYVLLLLAVAAVPGRLLRRRIDEVSRLTERAVRAELAVEAAAADERLRIARELHDIIGHSVSLMVVHAGAAESRLDDLEIARRSLQAVQEVGRQAVADLARLLGLLRSDHAEIGLAPQPGLRELEALVADAVDGGQLVSLAVDGDPGRVPTAMGLTIYRVVQEALTNTRKHADDARVTVSTAIGDHSVRVVVTDDGAGVDRGTTTESGHGLAGLDERVRMFGGTLAFGPRHPRGWSVEADLPLSAGPP